MNREITNGPQVIGTSAIDGGHVCSRACPLPGDTVHGILKAHQGEGGVWWMVDEDNHRTYKPGQLWDTYDREPNDVLIVQDKDGNRYRWTQQAWVAWNDQRSDALRRA